MWQVPLWPGPRVTYGECSTLLVGEGWYGTYDHVSGRAAVVAADGTPLGTLDLLELVGGATSEIDAVGAAGDQVAIAYASPRGRFLDTLRVTLAPAGSQPPRSASPRARPSFRDLRRR